MYGYIYKIENIVNGKVYIGQTTDIINRQKHHFTALRNNRHKNIHLQRAWNKYGEQSFKFDIIDEADEKFLLDNLESFWIDAYGGVNSCMTYNLRKGGSHGTLSEESKQKVREAKQGIPLSKEHRESISKAHTGMKQTWRNEEWNRRISESQMGHEVSQESITKQRWKKSKLVLCKETNKVYVGCYLAERDTGINANTIRSCCNGKNKSGVTHELHFVYIEKEDIEEWMQVLD